MTDPEIPRTSFAGGAGQAASGEALQAQLQNLRALFAAALMALLLLNVAVNIYLFRQFWMMRNDVQMTNSFLQDYQKNKEPLLNRLVAGLQTFARNHPDFTPILEKYGIKPSATGQASLPAPLPAVGSAGK